MKAVSWFWRYARRVLKWLGRDLKLVAGLLGVGMLAWGVIELADEVNEGATQSVDRFVLLALRADADGRDPIGPRWLESAVADITTLGGAAVASLVAILVAGFLLLARKPRAALLVATCCAGAAAAVYYLKALFDRGRPSIVTPALQADGLSFPSGHATISVALYLTLGVLVAGTLKERRLRVYVVLAAALLAFLIGFSRVYLGVHYPSDVLAGWTVGLAWALLCGLTERALQRRGVVEREAAGKPTHANPERR